MRDNNTLSLQSMIAFIAQILLLPVTIGLLVGVAKVKPRKSLHYRDLKLEGEMVDIALVGGGWPHDSLGYYWLHRLPGHHSHHLQAGSPPHRLHHHLPGLPHLDDLLVRLLIPC